MSELAKAIGAGIDRVQDFCDIVERLPRQVVALEHDADVRPDGGHEVVERQLQQRRLDPRCRGVLEADPWRHVRATGERSCIDDQVKLGSERPAKGPA